MAAQGQGVPGVRTGAGWRVCTRGRAGWKGLAAVYKTPGGIHGSAWARGSGAKGSGLGGPEPSSLVHVP